MENRTPPGGTPVQLFARDQAGAPDGPYCQAVPPGGGPQEPRRRKRQSEK